MKRVSDECRKTPKMQEMRMRRKDAVIDDTCWMTLIVFFYTLTGSLQNKRGTIHYEFREASLFYRQ